MRAASRQWCAPSSVDALAVVREQPRRHDGLVARLRPRLRLRRRRLLRLRHRDPTRPDVRSPPRGRRRHARLSSPCCSRHSAPPQPPAAPSAPPRPRPRRRRATPRARACSARRSAGGAAPALLAGAGLPAMSSTSSTWRSAAAAAAGRARARRRRPARASSAEGGSPACSSLPSRAPSCPSEARAPRSRVECKPALHGSAGCRCANTARSVSSSTAAACALPHSAALQRAQSFVTRASVSFSARVACSAPDAAAGTWPARQREARQRARVPRVGPSTARRACEPTGRAPLAPPEPPPSSSAAASLPRPPPRPRPPPPPPRRGG